MWQKLIAIALINALGRALLSIVELLTEPPPKPLPKKIKTVTELVDAHEAP